LDGGDKLCGEINQRAIDWALSKSGQTVCDRNDSIYFMHFISDPNTVERYEKYGQKLVIGADINVCAAGPCWIWKELEFKESQDRVNMTISSPQVTIIMTVTAQQKPNDRSMVCSSVQQWIMSYLQPLVIIIAKFYHQHVLWNGSMLMD
jgi:hypothetical protein